MNKDKKVVIKLQKEIHDLENNINNPKITKIKNNTIKNLKISANVCRLVAPYVLCGCILLGTCYASGYGLPFKSGEEVKKQNYIMSEYNSTGEFREEIQPEYYENGTNCIKFYTKWEKIEDGRYSREVRTYYLKNISKEEAIKLLEKDELEILDFVIELGSIKKEIRTNLYLEELNKDDFIQLVLYDNDKNNIVFREEKVSENIKFTLVYVLLSFVFGAITDIVRREVFGFNFKHEVENIKNEYKNVDIEHLKNLLKIKQENYKRLTR